MCHFGSLYRWLIAALFISKLGGGSISTRPGRDLPRLANIQCNQSLLLGKHRCTTVVVFIHKVLPRGAYIDFGVVLARSRYL